MSVIHRHQLTHWNKNPSFLDNISQEILFVEKNKKIK